MFTTVISVGWFSNESISLKNVVSFWGQQIPRDVITALMCFHLRSSCYTYIFFFLAILPFSVPCLSVFGWLAGILKVFVLVFQHFKINP